jgi:hypothetical protein
MDVDRRYGPAVGLQNRMLDALADGSALFNADVLANEVFLGRSAFSICVGWYLLGERIDSGSIMLTGGVETISPLVRAAYAHVESKQPHLLALFPQIRDDVVLP